MSLRLEMLQVARLAPRLLGDSTPLVRAFIQSQQNPDGGFRDRSGRSDLYYTVFGLDSLMALQADLPLDRVAAFLRSFGDGYDLDFVHLCCLARCWAAVEYAAKAISASPKLQPEPGLAANLFQRIEAFRARDGGYHPTARADFGSAYGCFLALGAAQDLRLDLPEPLSLVQCLKCLEREDGAWANERQIQAGSTNATAAAVMVLRHLNMPINAAAVGDWLLARADAEGGFRAAPNAPIPDLLSTATALHALSALQRDFRALNESCLDFVDTLWTNEGGFHGHWADEHLDCEYCFYGLLALGHLAV